MSEEDPGARSTMESAQATEPKVAGATTVAASSGEVEQSRRSQLENGSRQERQQDTQLTSTTGGKDLMQARYNKADSVHPSRCQEREHQHHKKANRRNYRKSKGLNDPIRSTCRTNVENTHGTCYEDTTLLAAQDQQSEFKPGLKSGKEKFQETVTEASAGWSLNLHGDVGQTTSSTAAEDLPLLGFKGGTQRNIKESGHAEGSERQSQRRGRWPPYGIRGQYMYMHNEPETYMQVYAHEITGSEHREADDKYLAKTNLRGGRVKEHRERKDKPDHRKSRFMGSKGEATRGKDKRKQNRFCMHVDYERQKTNALRALSHLNPTQSSQASVLIEQLRNETYECMVCCERVRCNAAVWSCQSCYHVFHLACIRKWAKCSAAVVKEGEAGGWRCPGCQNIAQEIPAVYKCFCGRVIDPEWKRHEGLTPHSCGELCHKLRESQCPHQCNQLCHPGPCPSCPVMVTKQCSCGKTNNPVRCGQQSTTISCKQVCNKILNCHIHRCKQICHPDACGDCKVNVQQTCYCGKQKKGALCGTGEPGCNVTDGKTGYFSCQNKCLRVLDCGNHYCQKMCHQGVCRECLLKPSLVCCCPCGKTLLSSILQKDHIRTTCLDPIPTCESTCDKILPCSPVKTCMEGGKDVSIVEHRCKDKCHLGECGLCVGIAKVKCRCGTNVKEIPCAKSKLEEFTCDQRCNKKKNCGRHRCNQKCCVDAQHRCELVCGKKLRCGHHKCLEPCHLGYCPPCLMSGFDELACHCGTTVLYPPIPCGTQPPECNKPCSRTHACSHPISHNCHSEEVCPPCTALTNKKCMGDHEVRRNIPCHVKDVSCGNVCGKLLICGHKCRKICHKPPCLATEECCVQPCELKRIACGHPCAAPCHPHMKCPELPCQSKVAVSCQCGRRLESVPCLQGAEKVAVAPAYQRIATETLANKMKDLQSGQSVDISSILKMDDKKTRQIACNETCALYERNRRLAEALNIENPDLSPKGTVRFSPFLVAEAKQNLSFVKSVEAALENLVEATLKMSCSQRSYSFPPMNSNQRRFVHEIAVYYYCSTRSYDQEPKRNTVVTATKDSRLPLVKLSCQIERELSPHPPQPIPFLPCSGEKPPRLSSDSAKRRGETWTQLTDYFADDLQD